MAKTLRLSPLSRIRHTIRRSVPALVFLAMLIAGGIPLSAHAAVPVWVVQIDAGTDYERSLERFLFDLFNTLQRRQEDFTAAFELQKIEKAREDVNKLFQETQEELRGFGLAVFEGGVKDQRLSANDGANPQGEPPVIVPITGSRIINDPLEYLNGEPATVARMVAACSINYVIWDQAGRNLFSGIPGPDEFRLSDGEGNHWNFFLDALGNTQPKCTYGRQPGNENDRECNADDTKVTINNLRKLKNTIITYLYSGHSYNIGDNENPFGPDDPTFGNTFFDGIRDSVDSFPPDAADRTEAYNRVKKLCDGVMANYRSPTPLTAALQVAHVARATAPYPTVAEAIRMVRNILSLPVLGRTLISSTNATFEEMDAAFVESSSNTLEGLANTVVGQAVGAGGLIAQLHQLNYQIGQGLRPENLYVQSTQLTRVPGSPGDDGSQTQIYLNTEYIVSPAVVLLQKMQAATQATFDLAGQGFLYLDADQTPTDILGRYNLVSTLGQQDERSVCNNLGQCLLLDPWLKPAADFRSAPDARLIGTSAGATPGSGLPAPFEDESAYVSLGNEKTGEVTGLGDFRYTLDRFRVTPNAGDNIRDKHLGRDFATNDWYDRVLEMYEARRNPVEYRFTINDWQCYIATWFTAKEPGAFDPDDPNAPIRRPIDDFGGAFDDYCAQRLGDRSY